MRHTKGSSSPCSTKKRRKWRLNPVTPRVTHPRPCTGVRKARSRKGRNFPEALSGVRMVCYPVGCRRKGKEKVVGMFGVCGLLAAREVQGEEEEEEEESSL